MTDVSALSHEYKTASEFSDAFNRALIALKKAELHVEHPAFAPERLADARHTLAQILDALAAKLDHGEITDDAWGRRIPGALVQRLHRERRGDLPYVIEDLQRIARVLRDASSPLSPQDLMLLDRLSAQADAETSTLFRRLMRV